MLMVPLPRALAALSSGVVDDADEVFAAFAADVVVGDVQGVIHVAFVVSVFDGVGVDVVLIDGEVLMVLPLMVY